MPKGLVVYLDDETYKRLKAMSINDGKTLKDLTYEMIRESLEGYEEFLVEQRAKTGKPQVIYE